FAVTWRRERPSWPNASAAARPTMGRSRRVCARMSGKSWSRSCRSRTRASYGRPTDRRDRMAHEKDARPDHPIQPVLARRWSPYVFADTEVSTTDLCAILEAARWAPSSYNEQPWRYLLARRSDPQRFEKLLSCLIEVNQTWAQHAPVLLVGVAVLTFARNGKP